MRYRIDQIKLDPGEGHDRLPEAIRKKLKRPGLAISDPEIIKESIDARRKPDVKLVYTVDFSCAEKLRLKRGGRKDYDALYGGDIRRLRTKAETEPDVARRPPVIVGFGPCGMFAALILAEAGRNPVVIERGQSIEQRVKTVERFWRDGVLDTESNVQFGEGGAGTFSDGKLTTGIKDVRISKVLAEFVRAGADPAILYKQKPHIGTDRLRDVVVNIRKRIENLGGEVVFDTRMTGLITEEAAAGSGKRIRGIRTIDRSGAECDIYTDDLVLAMGHSARDTFEMLLGAGLDMEQKPFSMGVRIEHLQEAINIAQYGSAEIANLLGAADYKLNHRCENGRGVYTFCMCPGGYVINASSEEGAAVTNGMSNSGRDGEFANSGLLVDVRTDDLRSDHPLAGVEFQRKYERLAYENGHGSLPKTTYGEFADSSGDCVRKSVPDFVAEAIIEAMPFLGKKLAGFDSREAVMTAVETRSSSPVRILRDDSRQAGIAGVYPAGEGPGYAGGIMSAAVDGIKTAEKILDMTI